MNKKEKEMMRFVATGKKVKFIKPKPKIKKITFEKRIFLLMDADTYIIMEFMEDGTVKVTSLGYLYYEELLDKKNNKDIYERLENLYLEKWKRSYKSDSIILDGEEWKLKIEYTDGTKKYRRGKNAYPENFNEFINLISSIKK